MTSSSMYAPTRALSDLLIWGRRVFVVLLSHFAIVSGVVPFQTRANAQTYPTRTVKIIENVAPGGTVDIFTRALANELHKRLGQPFIVEPRPAGIL